ncbi:decaprenyl-phosphate phosphoribosyltransferase [Iamia sp. SCSIO 61187]|uniref:decaprenyl-phosphate phosphoribosyltransferase n=1 Tax=Iamia sp. SCSIO 61187 TaxID=2722752 RepID=UPI001C63957B|nr:decaprenyl-phosphate phosphoribosyltransferase [Iamia sp. SCSIO 61187]QYG92658.1 decaprenyl-phosphate phosphoribosyltransferase [Iamia sp. SCSIO 61187]
MSGRATDATRRSRPLPLAVLVACRPKQWTKNLLVLAAPGAAGVLGQADAVAATVAAFVAFSLAASATYLLNDAGDVEADRAHATKRHRPIAAGELSVPLARGLAVAFAVAGAAVALSVRWQLLAVLAGYVALTTTYTLVLKHVVLLDVIALASGFVLRAVAGAVAADVPISDWFFIVTSFGSLFMAVGKRHAEVVTMGDDAGSHRKVLDGYSPSFLAHLRAVSSGVVLVAYCLWAFERADLTGLSVPWYQMSIVPFTTAVLRYAQLLDTGEGGAPEELVLADRMLLGAGAVWAAVFGIGVLAA